MLETVSRWSDFNVAMAGASAALAGLVIVAASVNIQKIVSAGTLTARLAAAIATLVLALVVSAVGLVPGIDLLWYGLVTIVVALGAAWFQAHATRVVMRDPQQRARVAKSALGILPIAAYGMPRRDRLRDPGLLDRSGRGAALKREAKAGNHDGHRIAT
jgi:hypothetical protein